MKCLVKDGYSSAISCCMSLFIAKAGMIFTIFRRCFKRNYMDLVANITMSSDSHVLSRVFSPEQDFTSSVVTLGGGEKVEIIPPLSLSNQFLQRSLK